MGYRISKCLKFVVAGLKLSAALFQVVASLQKFSFNPAADSAEPRHQRREQGKYGEIGQIVRCDIKGIKRLYEEIIETETGEHPGDSGSSWPAVPGGDSQGEKEKRDFYIAKMKLPEE